jgi:flagellar biosynthesis protein FlhG
VSAHDDDPDATDERPPEAADPSDGEATAPEAAAAEATVPEGSAEASAPLANGMDEIEIDVDLDEPEIEAADGPEIEAADDSEIVVDLDEPEIEAADGPEIEDAEGPGAEPAVGPETERADHADPVEGSEAPRPQVPADLLLGEDDAETTADFADFDVPEPGGSAEYTPELADAEMLAATIDVGDAPVDTPPQMAPSLAHGIDWSAHRQPLTIAFAGGKGGAGRSLLAANLGVYLSRVGRDVVVADLDPGGSNLHTYLGLEPLLPRPGDLLRATDPPRIESVPGAGMRLVRPPRPMGTGADDPLRAEALEAAVELGADALILDLGATADPLTLDAYLRADFPVVVVLPEPVGVERAYAFLRAALFRSMLHGNDDAAVVARAVLAADHVGQLEAPGDLVAALEGAHPEAAEALRARVRGFRPRILVNKCRTPPDLELAVGMESALRLRWGIEAEAYPPMEYDDAAWHSTRRRRPLMMEFPGSGIGEAIEKMARRILAQHGRTERASASLGDTA